MSEDEKSMKILSKASSVIDYFYKHIKCSWNVSLLLDSPTLGTVAYNYYLDIGSKFLKIVFRPEGLLGNKTTKKSQKFKDLLEKFMYFRFT